MGNNLNISIVIPVFNDWDCLELLLNQIYAELTGEQQFSVFIVDDGSTIKFPKNAFIKFQNLHVIALTRNLGHQKAITMGLCHVAEHSDCDAVIVMDGDGEDKPEDLKAMINTFLKKKTIVFAERKTRQENLPFKFFYQLYKISFLLLTGIKISFGNYCIIPTETLKKLVHVSEIWNHFSGGIIRSKLSYTSIPLDRGKRLLGESKMNLVSLIIHGVSSFTVHLDTVSVRLLILFTALITLSSGGAIYVAAVKFFTTKAIPGWATYTVIGLIIIILQVLFALLNLTLMILFARTQKLFIPAFHYKNYIFKVEHDFSDD